MSTLDIARTVLARIRQNALLARPSPTSVPVPTYTPQERLLLHGCPRDTLAAVDAAKRAFAALGGVTVEAVVPFKSTARDGAARLIRDARRVGDDGRAVAMRDAWRERLAICTMDGDLPVRDAERVALVELARTPRAPAHQLA